MALTLSTDAAPDAADLAGPADRFHAVVDRHFDAVAAFLARRVGPDVAQDLAQETFVTAFRKRHRFDPRFGSARPWLLGIATRAVAGHRREERRQLELYRRAAAASPRDGTAPPAALDPDLVDRPDRARPPRPRRPAAARVGRALLRGDRRRARRPRRHRALAHQPRPPQAHRPLDRRPLMTDPITALRDFPPPATDFDAAATHARIDELARRGAPPPSRAAAGLRRDRRRGHRGRPHHRRLADHDAATGRDRRDGPAAARRPRGRAGTGAARRGASTCTRGSSSATRTTTRRRSTCATGPTRRGRAARSRSSTARSCATPGSERRTPGTPRASRLPPCPRSRPSRRRWPPACASWPSPCASRGIPPRRPRATICASPR